MTKILVKSLVKNLIVRLIISEYRFHSKSEIYVLSHRKFRVKVYLEPSGVTFNRPIKQFDHSSEKLQIFINNT
jgi:hypothetical protein